MHLQDAFLAPTQLLILCVPMPVSTGLPSTNNLDRVILRHFRDLRQLKLRELQEKKEAPTNAKSRVITLQQEGVDPLSPALHDNRIAHHSELLGTSLGKRLHAKYSQEVSSNLQGQDGYAILDLVPESPNWKLEEKEMLLDWMYLEIQPHLGSAEAIHPTFSQVNMRKVQDTLMDKNTAPFTSPLTYFFLMTLNGREGTLFRFHIFQSYQLLKTTAGIPSPIKNLETDGMKFQADAQVLIVKKQSVAKKTKLVKSGFLECLPHLVSECTYLYLIKHCFV